MSEARGAIIEIVEKRKKPETDSLGASVVVPTEVRLNGQKLAIPAGAPITVGELSSNDVAVVTLTVFARRIFVGHEDVDDTVISDVAAATRALQEAHQKAVESQRETAEAIAKAQQDLAEANRRLSEATA